MKLNKSTKNALFILVIAVATFLAFEPIFTSLKQNTAQEVTAIVFGTIFAAVITMMLLNKQSETEEEKNRRDKVFEQKIMLYYQAIDAIQNIFEKSEDPASKITRKNILEIEFILAKLMMVGTDKTIYEFKNFYQSLTNNYSSESETVQLDSIDRQMVFRFADYCREELGLTDKNMEKDILEDIVLQSELLHRIRRSETLEVQTIEIIKRLYGYLVFDLGLDSRNIVFTPKGFNVYASDMRTDNQCFLQCLIEQGHVHLLLPKAQTISGFETEEIDGEKSYVLKAIDYQNIMCNFTKIENAIQKACRDYKI